jgi:hypothetical protein
MVGWLTIVHTIRGSLCSNLRPVLSIRKERQQLRETSSSYSIGWINLYSGVVDLDGPEMSPY